MGSLTPTSAFPAKDAAMIKDRMPDLLRLAQEHPDIYNEPEHHEEVPMPDDLNQVLLRVEKILKFLTQMKLMIEEIKKQHQIALSSATILNANELRNKITSSSNRFTAHARKTKSILQRIELSDQEKLRYGGYDKKGNSVRRRSNITVKWEQTSSSIQVSWPPSQSAPTYIPAEIRMQIIQHNVLSQNLTELVQEFYTEQKNYNFLSEKKIKRQLSILGEEMKEEDISRMADENIPLLHPQIMDDQQVSKEMKAKLTEVAHFEKEILALERNISQLHKAFLVMSTLVQEQGVMVDRIEHHVTMASDYVMSSNQQLKKAGKLQNKYRKKKCIFAIIVILILIGIAAIVAVSVVSKTDRSTATSAGSNTAHLRQAIGSRLGANIKIIRNS